LATLKLTVLRPKIKMSVSAGHLPAYRNAFRPDRPQEAIEDALTDGFQAEIIAI
jgi:hypothetical protein